MRLIHIAAALAFVAAAGGATASEAGPVYRVTVTPSDLDQSSSAPPVEVPYYFDTDSQLPNATISEGVSVFEIPVTEFDLTGGGSRSAVITFYGTSYGGGLSDNRPDLQKSVSTEALFTPDPEDGGPISNPILNDPATHPDAYVDFFGGGQVTIALAPISAAPEPAAWLLALFGVGLVGSTLRRMKGLPRGAALRA